MMIPDEGFSRGSETVTDENSATRDPTTVPAAGAAPGMSNTCRETKSTKYCS